MHFLIEFEIVCGESYDENGVIINQLDLILRTFFKSPFCS